MEEGRGNVVMSLLAVQSVCFSWHSEFRCDFCFFSVDP